jgi:hypothetical protein
MLPTIGQPEIFANHSADPEFISALFILSICVDSSYFDVSVLPADLLGLLVTVAKVSSEYCAPLSISILSKAASTSIPLFESVTSHFLQIIRSPKSLDARIAAIFALIPFFEIPDLSKQQRPVYESLIQIQLASKDPEMLRAILYLTSLFIRVSKKCTSIAAQNGVIDLCFAGLSLSNPSCHGLAAEILEFLVTVQPEFQQVICAERLLKQIWVLFRQESEISVIAGLKLIRLLVQYDLEKVWEKIRSLEMRDVSIKVKRELMKVFLEVLRHGHEGIVREFGECGGFMRVLECLEAMNVDLMVELVKELGRWRLALLEFVEVEVVMGFLGDLECEEVREMCDWVVCGEHGSG